MKEVVRINSRNKCEDRRSVSIRFADFLPEFVILSYVDRARAHQPVSTELRWGLAAGHRSTVNVQIRSGVGVMGVSLRRTAKLSLNFIDML